jgi:hypothetical protein
MVRVAANPEPPGLIQGRSQKSENPSRYQALVALLSLSARSPLKSRFGERPRWGLSQIETEELLSLFFLKILLELAPDL